MGSCMTRLKAEMVPPPPRSGNWQSCGPQRTEAFVPDEKNQVMYRHKTAQSIGNGAPLHRKETESGVPGLTYDHAGRPVWREENAVRIEHRENVW